MDREEEGSAGAPGSGLSRRRAAEFGLLRVFARHSGGEVPVLIGRLADEAEQLARDGVLPPWGEDDALLASARDLIAVASGGEPASVQAWLNAVGRWLEAYAGREARARDDQVQAGPRGRGAADERMLKTTEVARLLRVDPKTVRGWAKDNKVEHTKLLGGHYRFRASVVRELKHHGGPVVPRQSDRRAEPMSPDPGSDRRG